MSIKYKGKTISGGGGVSTAEEVSYNNEQTGMEAENVQDAIDQLFTSVSDGKALIASAITDMGVETDAGATWQQMYENILAIQSKHDYKYKAGIDWWESSLPTAENYIGGAYGAGKFVVIAASKNGYVYYSSDAVNWGKATLPNIAIRPSYITFGNGMFIITGFDANQYFYSYDGITWIASSFPIENTRFGGCAYGNGRFVVVGENSKALYSYDGITWFTSNVTLSSLTHVSNVLFTTGRFVAFSIRIDTFYYSTDGNNWTSKTFPTIGSNEYMQYACGDDISIISANKSITTYLKSYDGVNWIQGTFPSAIQIYNGLAHGNGMFIAADFNESNTCFYSYDGTEWGKANFPISAKWVSVVWGKDRFIAIGSNSNKIVYSLNTDTAPTQTKIKNSFQAKEIEDMLIPAPSGFDFI